MTLATTMGDSHPALLPAPAGVDDPIGIYVHIPFCAHICPYCDFNTYAGQAALIPDYVAALQRETSLWSARFKDRVAGSIFIGGGTPSLLTIDQISSVLDACKQAFSLEEGAEITIETNPNDLSEPYCTGLLEAGIRRISIGAQTLDRRGLRVLGRRHEADSTAEAVAAARRAGFTNISLDLIYGWPGQTLRQWESDLHRVLSGEIGGYRPDHLSLYSLIVEPGTPMADAVHRGILTPVDDDTTADFSDLAGAMLSDAGWTHYEIANWSAAPTKRSIHNAMYWRNGDYAGIGAGAHGHAGGQRTMNHLLPRRYINALVAGDSPVSNVEIIDERTAMGETMMLGLRLLENGVSREAFQARHGVALSVRYGGETRRLTGLGLLESNERSLRLTARGALLANSVSAEFL